jgi:Family of unknown function (DUF6069)
MEQKLNFKQVLTAGAIAGVAAAILNVLLFFIFHAVGIITDDIQVQPSQPLTIAPVLISSVLPSVVGAAVFFLFEKYTKNSFKLFTILALVLLVLSFGNPFLGIPNVTIGYAIALNLMHVVVAFSLLYFLKRAKR